MFEIEPKSYCSAVWWSKYFWQFIFITRSPENLYCYAPNNWCSNTAEEFLVLPAHHVFTTNLQPTREDGLCKDWAMQSHAGFEITTFRFVAVCFLLSLNGGSEWNNFPDSCYKSNQIRLGESGSLYLTSHEFKLRSGSPTTNKADCHWWIPKNRLGKQLHYS